MNDLFAPYPKIETLFNRSDAPGRPVLVGAWRDDLFEYLAPLEWVGTEKVDGTNIRVIYDGIAVRFAGRTERAQIPPQLLARLEELFPRARLVEAFGSNEVCLFGEGYGKGIQKAGEGYLDHPDFILFDVRVWGLSRGGATPYWLRRDDLEGVAGELGIRHVPIIFKGTLLDAVASVATSFPSALGNLPAEGMVLVPRVPLCDRMGQRVIAKIKTRDFGK